MVQSHFVQRCCSMVVFYQHAAWQHGTARWCNATVQRGVTRSSATMSYLDKHAWFGMVGHYHGAVRCSITSVLYGAPRCSIATNYRRAGVHHVSTPYGAPCVALIGCRTDVFRRWEQSVTLSHVCYSIIIKRVSVPMFLKQLSASTFLKFCRHCAYNFLSFIFYEISMG